MDKELAKQIKNNKQIWRDMLERDGFPKRKDKAIEEFDELTVELELERLNPLMSDKRKINMVDELADSSLMVESIIEIFKITPKMLKQFKYDQEITLLDALETLSGEIELSDSLDFVSDELLQAIVQVSYGINQYIEKYAIKSNIFFRRMFKIEKVKNLAYGIITSHGTAFMND